MRDWRDYNEAQYDALEARPSCCVCQDQGCEFCKAVKHSEPFPDDAFELFTIQDLQRLQRDAEREVKRRSKLN